MKKLFTIISMLLLLFTSVLNAQMKTPVELDQRLQGKTKFYDIKEEVINYYDQEKSRVLSADTIKKRLLNRQLKFWNRYFDWAESHLDKNGEVEKRMSSHIFEAVKQENTGNTNARTAYGAWSFVGPGYAPDGVGRVNRLAFHPTNPNIIYAGTANGGLWMLTWVANNYFWVCLTNHIPELSISGIVVSHANANTIYILTGDGDESGGFVNSWGYRGNSIGVLKTTDGGSNWFAVSQFPGLENTAYRGYQLIQDPDNANTLLAATTKGIFKTTNGGNSWVRSNMPPNVGDDNPAFDIEYKPGSSSIVYAAYESHNGNTSVRFFKSIAGGDYFESVLINNLNDVNRAAIAVTPKNPNYVYFVCGPGYIVDGDASDNRFNGFFWSGDSGDNFSFKSNTPDILGNITSGPIIGHQSKYDLAIAASTINASIVMVGGLIVSKSEDRGVVFDEMTDYFPSDPDDDDCIHPDVHDLAYNPLDGRLYAASDGGVSVSSDNGDHFSTLFSGMQIAQFYHFEPSNEDGKVWGGTQDCGILEQNSGTSFSSYAGGDGYDVLTDKTGNNDDSYYVVNTSIRDDSPVGFDDITPSTENEFFPLIALHPTNEDILYAGYTNRLYISLERGDNWQFRGTTSNPTSARWALSVCPSNSGRVYCAGNKNSTPGMWRVDNVTSVNFTSTNVVSALTSEGYAGNKITAIAVNPSNSLQVWISVAGLSGNPKVFFTSDGGSSFEDKTGSLPDAIPAMSIITDAAGNTYVGTDIGVYYRNNSMSDWTPFFNGLPRVAISELRFLTVFNVADPPNPFRYLYASTFGRGIWRTEIFEDCTPTLSITQTLQGPKFYQAGNSITSTSTVTGGVGTIVNFQSGNSITLNIGFESTADILFHGYIRGCNTGPLPFGSILINKDSLLRLHEPLPACIESAQLTGENLSVTLKVTKEGSYTLVLLNEEGEMIKTLTPEKDYMAGRFLFNLNSSEIKKGFYQVALMQGNIFIHSQEYNIE